jgi:hypothetical protein
VAMDNERRRWLHTPPGCEASALEAQDRHLTLSVAREIEP